jgi:hypothetical protein
MGGVDDDFRLICKLSEGLTVFSSVPVLVRNDGFHQATIIANGDDVVLDPGEAVALPWPPEKRAIVAEVCEDLAETHRDRSGGVQWSPEDIERFKAEMAHRAAVREEVYRGLHAPKVIGVINDPNGGRVGEVKG